MPVITCKNILKVNCCTADSCEKLRNHTEQEAAHPPHQAHTATHSLPKAVTSIGNVHVQSRWNYCSMWRRREVTAVVNPSSIHSLWVEGGCQITISNVGIELRDVTKKRQTTNTITWASVGCCSLYSKLLSAQRTFQKVGMQWERCATTS